METSFKKIGLAITFSPTGHALLAEAKKLQRLFNAELILIHVGEKNESTVKRLDEMIISSGLETDKTTIEYEHGDVADSIIKKCKEKQVDLLISGALEKESMIKYYFGSVARRVMREAPCSILICPRTSINRTDYKKICVTVDYSPQGEFTVRTAYKFALLNNSTDLILVREFQVPGFAMSVNDDGSLKEAEEVRTSWKEEEKSKMGMLIRELQLTGLNVTTTCLYGKEGWEVNKYAEEVNADLLVLSAPKRKMSFWDKVFQHDIEFTFSDIPCPLLIVKSEVDVN
ncbi:MAG: universal stress protein [Ignavibacteriales bacterium]|nr:MAG: universal stress protein [Ignavibacteriales bacterium]